MFVNRFAANKLAANNGIANRFAANRCPNHKDFRGFTSPVKKSDLQDNLQNYQSIFAQWGYLLYSLRWVALWVVLQDVVL